MLFTVFMHSCFQVFYVSCHCYRCNITHQLIQEEIFPIESAISNARIIHSAINFRSSLEINAQINKK